MVLDVVDDDLRAVARHFVSPGERQMLVHRAAEAVAEAGVKILHREGFQRRGVVDGGARRLAAEERGRFRRPGRFEFRPPAGRKIFVHVHRAADVDVGGDQRHPGVARVVEAPRTDGDPMDGHARLAELLHGVVGAAGVGDDAVIGVDGGARPTLGVGALVERDGVNRDFHCAAPDALGTRSAPPALIRPRFARPPSPGGRRGAIPSPACGRRWPATAGRMRGRLFRPNFILPYRARPEPPRLRMATSPPSSLARTSS